MHKKIFYAMMICVFLISASGCVAVLLGAGAAGGAVWTGGKLKNIVEAPYDRVVKAAEVSLNDLGYSLEKSTQKTNVTQLIAMHKDGRKTWVDINTVSPKTTKISVRVGIKGDNVASQEIIDRIMKRL